MTYLKINQITSSLPGRLGTSLMAPTTVEEPEKNGKWKVGADEVRVSCFLCPEMNIKS
jgi:hypothetical protein